MLFNKGYHILVDIPGYLNLDSLFEGQRPDIALCFKSIVYAIDLTICFEINFEKSRKYKEERYRNFRDKSKVLKVFYVEFSSLGFTTADMIDFTKWLRRLGVDINRMISVST